MKELEFSINIQASRETVWHTLWQKRTFREWAGIIDPGTYMNGELVEGKTVEFISAENGYGVTSLVASVIPNEYLLLKHKADTKDTGESLRADQWTGGNEAYKLTEHDGVTRLLITFDVPIELEMTFNNLYPQAMKKIKELSEVDVNSRLR